MTRYTLAKAAKAAGRTKVSILRAIQAGKISAEKNIHGQWEVDPAELHRVYPPITQSATQDDQDEENVTTRSGVVEAENEALRDRIATLELLAAELRADKDELKADKAALRRDLEQWRGFALDAQQLLKALEAPPPSPEPQQFVIEHVAEAANLTKDKPRPSPWKKERGFWARLFS